MTYTTSTQDMVDNNGLGNSMTQGNFQMDLSDFWVDCGLVDSCAAEGYDTDAFDGSARGFAMTAAATADWSDGGQGDMPSDGSPADMMICNGHYYLCISLYWTD